MPENAAPGPTFRRAMREHEKLKDTGEDAKDAVKDAGAALKEEAESLKEKAK